MRRIADLDRRFLPIRQDDDGERLAENSYLSAHYAKSGFLSWPDLLDRDVVVVLGEPGSGKSWEFEFQARKVESKSNHAFLLPLDGLAEKPLTEVLHGRDLARYRSWKVSGKSGLFFFDSVDESKLRSPKDFFVALDNILDGIGIRDLSRAKLFFSSRISEWRPATDLFEIQHRFCSKNRSRQAAASDENEGVSLPLVVSLVPLDNDRVKRYAEFCGLKEVSQFISALDDHHAWDFARRPLDIQGLFAFWTQNARLGTLTEIIEDSIARSLRE